MLKQWVKPLLNNGMVPGGFLLGSHFTSVIFYFIFTVFIGILGEGFEIQFLAIFLIGDLIKFEIKSFFMFLIKVFVGILGAPKIPPNNKNRSPCLPFGGVF